MPTPPIYRLESVEHRYGERVVLRVPELDIPAGETLAVMGPSGAGKSTLLRLLQFLECPSGGRLVFDGSEVKAAAPLHMRRRVTTVFQRPMVLSRSVVANMAYGRRVRGLKGQEEALTALISALGLAHVARSPARLLSGGEIQRMAVGRALACDPDVLLLDEPTANLDPRNVSLVEGLIRERHARGVTIVIATHQVFQARRLASCAAFLLDGQLIETGPVARLFDTPHDPRTRAFLSGEMVY